MLQKSKTIIVTDQTKLFYLFNNFTLGQNVVPNEPVNSSTADFSFSCEVAEVQQCGCAVPCDGALRLKPVFQRNDLKILFALCILSIWIAIVCSLGFFPFGSPTSLCSCLLTTLDKWKCDESSRPFVAQIRRTTSL